MNLLAGTLLVTGCSKSPTTAVPDAGQGGDLVERAKAEAVKEFNSSWTNTGSIWAGYLINRKSLLQLTNVSVRVEAVELSEKERQAGVTWGAEVFFAAQLARKYSAKNGWDAWGPTKPFRYPVIVSNGVWCVENNYRKTYALPPDSQ